MNIAILTYVEAEGSKEYDPVVRQVAAALREGGHKPTILGIHGDVNKLVAGVARTKPDVVFNIMEMFENNMFSEVSVAGLLDLLKVPYTGNGPGEHYLQQDKGLAKKLLAFDNILYPDFAVFSADASLETGGNLRMPLFVKPLRADASLGIDSHSLVRSSMDLMERVVHIHKQFNDGALAEEYIEGREFYIGVLGNQDAVALPPIEMDFSGLEGDQPRIMGSKAKWKRGSAEYKGTKAVLADLAEDVAARLQRVALDAYRALRVRDYGRIDMRMTAGGEIYVIEVNASCYLEESGEFATAAAAAGIVYVALINKIVELALERRKKR